MKLSEVKSNTEVAVEKINISRPDIVRRLGEIGIKEGKRIRLIKKSRISKCVLVETLGAVFILDFLIAEGIVCNE